MRQQPKTTPHNTMRAFARYTLDQIYSKWRLVSTPNEQTFLTIFTALACVCAESGGSLLVSSSSSSSSTESLC